MSKIGKAPIKIQDNNQVEITKKTIKITGPKGVLECNLNDKVDVKFDSEAKEIILQPKKEGREFFAI
jgi:ribosomal protein L6P/L9E